MAASLRDRIRADVLHSRGGVAEVEVPLYCSGHAVWGILSDLAEAEADAQVLPPWDDVAGKVLVDAEVPPTLRAWFGSITLCIGPHISATLYIAHPKTKERYAKAMGAFSDLLGDATYYDGRNKARRDVLLSP